MLRIINGSFVIFLLLFISPLVLGRGFCGWVCPAGGYQEAIFSARSKKVTKGDFVKWAIWIPWISAIVIIAIESGGYSSHRTLHTYRSSCAKCLRLSSIQGQRGRPLLTGF
jgi:polyferredoxin